MRVAPKEGVAVAAAATDTRNGFRWGLLVAGVLGFCLPLTAAVLPEDRADALYHAYSGGGLDVSGPSLLARKQLGKYTSLFGNYYVDSISSASIDVVTTASPYTEYREEKTVGGDFLYEKTLFNLSMTNSEESDFNANSAAFGISHSMFGDLTTISLGYGQGWDTIRKRADKAGNIDPNFKKKADRQRFRLGLSQVLSKNSLIDLNYELVTDEGYLNNPYRSVRYLDGNGAYQLQAEQYPNTRTSHALGLKALYYLPYRAVVHGEVRGFIDTWGIDALIGEIGYIHPLGKAWILEASYRYYTQSRANFYSDLFTGKAPSLDDCPYCYRARDKELSTYYSHGIGLGASYHFARQGWGFIDKGSLNVKYNYMQFNYQDFSDLRAKGLTPGSEPLYSFSAYVLRLFVSIWY